MTATAIPFAPKAGPFADTMRTCMGCSVIAPIGFNFTFYGNTYTTVKVSVDGFITFTNPQSLYSCCAWPIPVPDGVDNLIAEAVFRRVIRGRAVGTLARSPGME